MVQSNQFVSYLDTMMVQPQAKSKTSGSDEKRSDFAEALDKEFAQDKEPVKNETTGKTEQTAGSEQKPEAATEGSQKEGKEAEAAAVAPWLMAQAPVVQQAVTNLQMTTKPQMQAEDNTVQQIQAPAADGEMLTAQTEAVQVNAVQTNLPGQSAAVETAGQAADDAGVLKQSLQDSPLTQQLSAAEDAPQQMQQVKPAGENAQSAMTGGENQPQTGANGAEVLSQTTANQQVQQSAFEAPRATASQTVNMTNPQEGMQNLGKTMSEQMLQGKNSFEIWLEPANLGKMGIKVDYEGGRAIVSIICTSEKAMELISQSAKYLGNILQQNTGTNTVVVIEQPEQEYLERESGQPDRENREEQKESEKQNKEQESENESFLHQLRLGLK